MIFHSADEVLAAVQIELNDPEYADMEHHNLKTYNEGCRGPLCRKKMRDYGREQYRAKQGVAPDGLHKPTVRTQWDELLAKQPTRLDRVA